MDRVKIQEIADEAGASNAVLIEKAKELGYDVKVANSTVTVEEAGILIEYAINGVKPKSKTKAKALKKVSVVKKSEKTESTTEKNVNNEESTEVIKEEITPIIKKTKRNSRRIGSITATPKNQKKRPIIIEEVKLEVVKEEAPVVEEVKEEAIASKPEEVKEAVSTEVKVEEATIPETPVEEKKEEAPVVEEKPKVKRKRIGITVIKKADRNKPRIRIVEERKPVEVQRKKPMGMPTPPSKKKIKKIATAKESGEKLNFMSNSGFGGYGRGQVTEVEDEPEVLMLDFSDKNIYEDMMRQEAKRKEEAKKRAAAGGGQTQNRGGRGGFRRRPSGLRRGGKRKKYIREESSGQITSIEIPENVRVYEFAEKVGRSTGDVIKVVFSHWEQCLLKMTSLIKTLLKFLQKSLKLKYIQ